VAEETIVDSKLAFVGFVLVISVLAIFYAAFQRWLQHKEKTGLLIAEQTAERAAQYGAHVERVEARLRVVEQIVTDPGVQTAAQIDSLREKPLPDPTSKSTKA